MSFFNVIAILAMFLVYSSIFAIYHMMTQVFFALKRLRARRADDQGVWIVFLQLFFFSRQVLQKCNFCSGPGDPARFGVIAAASAREHFSIEHEDPVDRHVPRVILFRRRTDLLGSDSR